MRLISQKKMLERAMDVAAFLSRDPRIAQVYLFGSLAREGDGHDIDLIVVPKKRSLALKFLDLLNEQIGEMAPDDHYFGGPEARFGIFYSIFGSVRGFGSTLHTILDDSIHPHPAHVDAYFPLMVASHLLDVFVLPADWQTSKLAKTSLRTRDPLFLDNVVRDAVLFNPEHSIFVWPIRRLIGIFAHQLWRRYLIFEQKGARANWLILSGILNHLDFHRRQRRYELENNAYRITLAIIRKNAAQRSQRLPDWLQNMNG